MLFRWLQKRKRQKILAAPFPVDWLQYLERNGAHYRLLAENEKAKLRDDLRIFIAEKRWEGCKGLQLTDEMKVTIAAHACLLILALDHDYFRRVRTILVYPEGFMIGDEDPLRDELVIEEHMGALGQIHYRGPVIISWADALAAGQTESGGINVVLHEFAHELDFLDGTFDGTPPLQDRAQYKKWQEIMTQEYNLLVRNTEKGKKSLLDQYGTENEGEFFAVATECFFEKPVAMAQRHPRLYDLLREYYHQDPAKRFARAQAGASKKE
jgi:Mlc titration factor MtfA (ptsG expression regulator)